MEAGDEEPLVTHIPAMYLSLYGSNVDYVYQTQPEPFACAGKEGKSCNWPRGKIMGGSSSINGMTYVRGSRQVYDDWATLGNEGWSYDDVLPYFKKSEDNQIPEVSVWTADIG